jgi:hypothetical protein
VRVHVTRISALDHGLFRFDKNLSFAILFMNSDLDMYGRFGTRAGGSFKGPFRPMPDTLHMANKDMSSQGFLRAVARVLDLHSSWKDEKRKAAIKELLAPKLGKTYLGRPLRRRTTGTSRARGRGRNECFHCHRIAEEEVGFYFNNRKPVPDELLWSFPMPDKIGFVLDSGECATIQSVVSGSDAANAGMKKGDDILVLNGHHIVSIADVQWALDQAPDDGKLPVRIKRDGKEQDITLELPKGWRRRDQFAWRYSFNGLKGKVLGLDELSELTDAERKTEGIQANESSVRIGRVLRARRGSGFNAKARASGLRSKDIILQIDGGGRNTESEILAYVLQEKHPGDEVKLTVLRNAKRLDFTFAVQRILKRRGHDH